MALYVLKTFDLAGHLIGREQFRAPRDQEATATMRYLYEKRSCELWRGSRMVRVWDGGPAAGARRKAPGAVPRTGAPQRPARG